MVSLSQTRYKPYLQEFIISRIELQPAPYPHLCPCWIWTGAVMKGKKIDGNYGMIRPYVGSRKRERIHRLTYTLYRGIIPPELMCLHQCDNKMCCNPYHITLGTALQNSQDYHTRGKRRNEMEERGIYKLKNNLYKSNNNVSHREGSRDNTLIFNSTACLG